MLTTILVLLLVSSAIAQDFGAVFNKSSATVNFITADQAKSYETREEILKFSSCFESFYASNFR